MNTNSNSYDKIVAFSFAFIQLPLFLALLMFFCLATFSCSPSIQLNVTDGQEVLLDTELEIIAKEKNFKKKNGSVSIIWRLNGQEVVKNKTGSFSDLDENSYIFSPSIVGDYTVEVEAVQKDKTAGKSVQLRATTLLPPSIIEDSNVYWIQTHDEKKVLEITRNFDETYDQIYANNKSWAGTQKFKFTPLASGNYLIQCDNSEFFLDAQEHPEDGIVLTKRAKSGNDSQQFRLSKQSNGLFIIYSVKYELTIEWNESSKGTPNIALRSQNNSMEQQFKLSPLNSTNLLCVSSNEQHHFAWYKDGTVTIGSAQDPQNVFVENLADYRGEQAFNLGVNNDISNVISISTVGDTHYTWFIDGTLSGGSIKNMTDQIRLQAYAVAEGKTYTDIAGISSIGSTHYAWYKDRTVSSGTLNDLNKNGKIIRVQGLQSDFANHLIGISSHPIVMEFGTIMDRHNIWHSNLKINTAIGENQGVFYLYPDKDFGFEFDPKEDRSSLIVTSTNYVEQIINGQFYGTFSQIGAFLWEESFPNTNQTKRWVETYRTGHLIALKGEGQEYRVIDLYDYTIKRASKEDYSDLGFLCNIHTALGNTNGYTVRLVEYTHPGFTDKHGEFYKAAEGIWKEIDGAGLYYQYKETDRDDQYLYLYDETRFLSIQIDLKNNKISSRKGNGGFTSIYNIVLSYGLNEPAREGVISFPGSTESMSIDGFRTMLEDGGFKLVKDDKALEENECKLLIPYADEDNFEAGFGTLVCNTRIGDKLALNFQAVHGKCGARDVREFSAGSECEVVTGATELKLIGDDGTEKVYNFEGPGVNTCAAVSPQKLCANAGAQLFGVKFTDKNENAFGVSLGVGIGGDFDVDFEDGVLKLEGDLKVLIGGSVSLDINLAKFKDDPYDAGITLSETAWMVSGGLTRVAAEPLKALFSELLPSDIAAIPNTMISLTTECPFDVAAYIFTLGQREIDCLDGAPGTEWLVEIDACHTGLDATGTDNIVAVEFWSGNTYVDIAHIEGPGSRCYISDSKFTIDSDKNITHVFVKTEGDDAYYIDELRMYHGGELKQHHGRDNGSGWCLSTQEDDYKGGWENKVAYDKCSASIRFDY